MKKLLTMVWVSVLLLATNLNPTAQFAQAASTARATASPVTTLPETYDLENEPSSCIGFLPKPGCGKEPQDAGERGGALQYAVFVIMLAGLGVVGFGLARNMKKQKPVK